MNKIKVLSVFGTRPEAIKMCPLAVELNSRPEFEHKICLTGQHREQLDQVMSIFGLGADADLNIMQSRQGLPYITSKVLTGLDSVLKEMKPSIVLVHGDTTTTFAAALAAFYRKIPIGHVEAGLRTNDIYSPYPEEMNRLLTARLSAVNFAPTELNRSNLLREGVTAPIYVTGNTVIDCFKNTVKKDYRFKCRSLGALDTNKKILLVTAHRRENLGAPLQNICGALKEIAMRSTDCIIVYPVHLNPSVRETVMPALSDISNIVLTDPVDVEDMHNLMAKSYIVLTDSGGLQEEAPYFGIPTLVLRTETERPEAVTTGTVKIIGTKQDGIVNEVEKLLSDTKLYIKMANAVNPYGDGCACVRIANELLSFLGGSRTQ